MNEIRCPGCGGKVALPAEVCPACLYDFHTGLKPEAMDADGGRGRVLLVGGLVLAAILVLGFAFLFHSGGPGAPPSLPPTAAGVPDSEIGEALTTFDELNGGPAALQPGPIVNKTQEVVEGLNEQQKKRDEIFE